jgi:hypothetical protein
MKLGTVLASLSAATLLLAQPAAAATRSASSLPQPGAKIEAVDARVGSPIGARQNVAAGSAQFLWLVALIGFAAALIFVVADEDSFDDIDELPDSPA